MKQKEAKLLHDKNKIIALKIFTQEIYDANAFSDENLFIDSSGLRSKFSKSDQIVDEQLWGWGGGKVQWQRRKQEEEAAKWMESEWMGKYCKNWLAYGLLLPHPTAPAFPLFASEKFKKKIVKKSA